MYRLAILTAGPREAPEIAAVFDELRLSGFIEGQNLTVDGRGFRARDDSLSAIAAEIVKSAADATSVIPRTGAGNLEGLITRESSAPGFRSAHPGYPTNS